VFFFSIFLVSDAAAAAGMAGQTCCPSSLAILQYRCREMGRAVADVDAAAINVIFVLFVVVVAVVVVETPSPPPPRTMSDR
jgi:hypothetical protein